MRCRRARMRLRQRAGGRELARCVVASGVSERHPGITWKKQAFGISAGGRCETRLAPGDRVEVYRALAIDPKEARRRRAAKKR